MMLLIPMIVMFSLFHTNLDSVIVGLDSLIVGLAVIGCLFLLTATLALVQIIEISIGQNVKKTGKTGVCKFVRFGQIRARGYSLCYMVVSFIDEFGIPRFHKVYVPFSYVNRPYDQSADIPCVIKGSRCYVYADTI